MADFYVSLGANAQLHLQAYEVSGSANVGANTTVVHGNVWLERTAGTGRYNANTNNTWSINIDGQVLSGSGAYDLRGGGSMLLFNNDFTITHNSDGSKTIYVGASINVPSGNIGSGTAQGNLALFTIPRASNATFSAVPTAGSPVTIYTNRASGDFTHTITWAFGNQTGSIASGVTDSVSWTPPMGMLTEIPNAPTGVGGITTITYNGGSEVGRTNTGFTLQAPASAGPNFTTVTNSEATTTPNVASIVGAYVKNISKLNVAITGASAQYGATVTGYQIAVAGQQINAQSGVTGVISQTGSLSLVGTVTDSRGFSTSKTVTINVLDYSPPNIASYTGIRSSLTGTPDTNGTTLKIAVQAAVQSLVVGSQKNNLTLKIKTKVSSDTTDWASVPVVDTVNANAVGYNDFRLISTYPVANSYKVRIEVTDNLAQTAVVELTVGTGGVLLHLAVSDDAIGIGQYWQTGRGSLDAKLRMYQRDGKAVVDVDDLAANGPFIGKIKADWTWGSPTVDIYGTDGVTVINTVTALVSNSDPDLQPGAMVTLNKYGTQYLITGSYGSAGPAFLRKVKLYPESGSGWIGYADRQPSNGYAFGESRPSAFNAGTANASPFYVTKSKTSVVAVEGLLMRGGAPAVGSTIFTLPVGFRPYGGTLVFMGVNGVNGVAIMAVQTDGKVLYIGGDPGYFALNRIVFRAAGSAEANAAVTMSPLQTGFSASTVTGYAGPSYTVDADGLVLTQGRVKNTSGGTLTNANVYQMPTAHTQLGHHFASENNGAVGYFRLSASGGVGGTGNWINIGGALAANGENSINGAYALPGTFVNRNVGPAFNSWGSYDAANWAFPSFGKASGMVLQQGLWGGGSAMITVAHYMDQEYRPSYTGMYATISNQQMGRVDYTPASFSIPDARVVFAVGSPTWFSTSGILYPAGQ